MKEDKIKKDGRGGRRPGAGRPAGTTNRDLGKKVKVSVKKGIRIPAETDALIKALVSAGYAPNQSAAISRAISEAARSEELIN